VEERARDLAMLHLNIDSKLCGCHVISRKVEDVAPHGVTVDRAIVRESKTIAGAITASNWNERAVVTP
jgi:hypothetical protein